MKRKTILLSLVFAVTVCLFGLFACGGEAEKTEGGEDVSPAEQKTAEENIGYTEELEFYPLNDGTYGVAIGKAYYLQTITVPSEYKGARVSEIIYRDEKDAFTNVKNIYYTGTASEWAQIDGLKNIMTDKKSLYIGGKLLTEANISGIIEIKPYAFAYCTDLKKLSVSDSVVKIGERAFYNCVNLTAAAEDYADSYTLNVEKEAFYGCPAFAYVDTTNENMQYVVFMITNRSYRDLEPYLQEMVELHGKNDPSSHRMYAYGAVGPFVLNHTIETMREQVNKCFEWAEKYDIPVYFQMDDCKQYFTFTEGGAAYFGDEENCVHTGALDGKTYTHFYDDPDMCEWIALPTADQKWGGEQYGALPRWVCDWGDINAFAHVKGGFPCFNSESYLAWYDNQVTEGFIKPLLSNLKRLKKLGKEYLFAGVATGWETMIPDYSSDSVITNGSYDYYSRALESWEKTPYGMHAVYNLKDDNGNRLYDTEEKIAAGAVAFGFGTNVTAFKRAILCGVVATYITHTCKLFYDAGISRLKILSHTLSYASQWEENVLQFDTFTLPIWTSINDYCLPAWSMAKSCPYNLDIIYKLVAKYAPDINAFANAEGYSTNGQTEEECRSYMETFLGGNARLITIFGYDNTDLSTGGYSRDSDYFFTRIIKEWREKTFLPDYEFSARTPFST